MMMFIKKLSNASTSAGIVFDTKFGNINIIGAEDTNYNWFYANNSMYLFLSRVTL